MEKRREKKASLSEEAKEEIRKKDKYRKRVVRYLAAEKDKEERTDSYIDNEKEHNKNYKKKAQDKKSNEEIEYERIQSILGMRKYRQFKTPEGSGFNGKLHLLLNWVAKKGMRYAKSHGYMKEFMRRAAREKDEEVLWEKFWRKTKKHRDYFTKKNPELAEKFKERIKDGIRKEEERMLKEKELDEKGRWNFSAGDGEYYWSIPDDEGKIISLSTFNMTAGEDYCDATIQAPDWPDKMREEDEGADQLEVWHKELKQWEEQEKKEHRMEINRKQNERRQKVREELAKPIHMPKQSEKGEYEKCRDDNILKRHEAMKESGLFTDTELQAMLNMIK